MPQGVTCDVKGGTNGGVKKDVLKIIFHSSDSQAISFF